MVARRIGSLIGIVVVLVVGCRQEADDDAKPPAGLSDGETDTGVDDAVETGREDTDAEETGETDTGPEETLSTVSTRDDYVEIVVASGGGVACAIREDRTADCWGEWYPGWGRWVEHIDHRIVDLGI